VREINRELAPLARIVLPARRLPVAEQIPAVQRAVGPHLDGLTDHQKAKLRAEIEVMRGQRRAAGAASRRDCAREWAVVTTLDEREEDSAKYAEGP
jgi:hypothetical protein